jgi:alanine racemase
MFKPVLQIKTQVLTIQLLHKGDYVGYDSCWQAKKDTKIAVIALGYADGIPADIYKINWFVEINEKLYPIVGKVSMDLCAVEVGIDSDVKIEDFVNFFSEKYNLYYLSNLIGRSNYEIISQLGYRLERVLVD